MEVTLLPLGLRPPFEMASRTKTYKDRLLELCGGDSKAKELRDEFNLQLKPVFHKWGNYNKIALEEAAKGMSPSEKSQLHSTIKFE